LNFEIKKSAQGINKRIYFNIYDIIIMVKGYSLDGQEIAEQMSQICFTNMN
jgi:hypothetical protein